MVWVSPGIFDTKVMVAPNSPIALAKPSTMPASTPGNAKGKVMVRNTRQGAAPSVPAAPPPPAPEKAKPEAEWAREPRANEAAPAERQQQQITGDNRRQHQRQVDQGIEDRLAPEIEPRQHPCR